MHRFRLNRETIAVIDDPQARIVMIPAGSEIVNLDEIQTDRVEHSKQIAVDWNGKRVRLFLVDLLERGESAQNLGE